MNAGFAVALCIAIGADPKSVVDDQDVWPMNVHSFSIPIQIDPGQKDDIEELILWVSSDQGKTWKKAGTATPMEKTFSYSAPQDGLYWFTLQIVKKDKKKEPPEIAKAPPHMKVRVDTTTSRRTVRMKSPTPEEEIVELRAKVAALEKRLAALEEREKPVIHLWISPARGTSMLDLIPLRFPWNLPLIFLAEPSNPFQFLARSLPTAPAARD